MEKEIPQLIAVALRLSDKEVTQLIRGYGDGDIVELELYKWRIKMESSNVAAFFNECLVTDSDHKVRVSDLYADYKDFCEEAGLKPVSLVKFPKQIDELCSTDIGKNVAWDKSGRHAYFVGLRLRGDDFDTSPTHEQSLMKLSEASQLAPVAPVDAPIDAPIDAPVKSLPDGGLHQLHQLEGDAVENNISDQLSEIQPVELPQTEPDNLPPSTAHLKSETSQIKRELEFVGKLQNGEKLTTKEDQSVNIVKKGVAQVCGYRDREDLLKDWRVLTPYQKRCLELAVNTLKDGVKFLTKTLPRLGITPTELGLSDPNPKPAEPEGDQMSLL